MEQERQLIVDSRLASAAGGTAQPFYNFITDVDIDAQSATFVELRGATMAINLPVIGPQNDQFTWTRGNPLVAPQTVTLDHDNETALEILTDLAAKMSAADATRNYNLTAVSTTEWAITPTAGSTIVGVDPTASFVQSLIFDMPTDPSRYGGTTITFFNFSPIPLPWVYLRIKDFTEQADHKGSAAGNVIDHVTALDLSGGSKVAQYSFDKPIKLGFWKGKVIPRKVRVEVLTYPGTANLVQFYRNGIVPTNAYITLYFALMKQ